MCEYLIIKKQVRYHRVNVILKLWCFNAIVYTKMIKKNESLNNKHNMESRPTLLTQNSRYYYDRIYCTYQQ